ncbi:MAG: hypothetical protein DPW09_35500 [Anaerolineae bacterium]|nr:hypothetical protein [Anaerolineales bacterium]MCQ3978759.1 hypothetical protein [Anaerolineae bacterium]
MRKLMISLATSALIGAAALTQSGGRVVETALAQEVVEAPAEVNSQNPYGSETMRVLMEEMTLVWLQSEEYAHIVAACAGNGLKNIQPLADGPMVLIPNAGDLAVEGSNVSIKLTPDGQITFIPRTIEQRIRVPMDVGDKVAGQEVLSLSLAEAEQLAAAGKLTWTASNQGQFGTGHGLPGHIAECDPQYNEEFYPTEAEREE